MPLPKIRRLTRRSLSSGFSLVATQLALEKRLATMEATAKENTKLLKRILKRMKMRPIAEAVLLAGRPYKHTVLKKLQSRELLSIAGALGVKNPLKYGTRTRLVEAIKNRQIEDED